MPRQVTNDDLTELVDLITESGRFLEERKTRLRQLKITVEYYLQQTEEEVNKRKQQREDWGKKPSTPRQGVV